MFMLAAVGCALDQLFKDRFEVLKAAHRILSEEVKSRQAYERPPFVSDLLDLPEDRGSPIFIEVRDFYKQIIRWAQSCQIPTKGVADVFVRFTRDSLKDFRKLPQTRAMERTLPISDTSLKGKLLWILPNLTSFTYIYARINRLCRV